MKFSLGMRDFFVVLSLVLFVVFFGFIFSAKSSGQTGSLSAVPGCDSPCTLIVFEGDKELLSERMVQAGYYKKFEVPGPTNIGYPKNVACICPK